MTRTAPDRPPAGPDPDWVPRVRRGLLEHYDRCARRLPWRGETDPYRIWVSEVMLQQTRVKTVIPYYRAWLKRFPDLPALADAEPDEVLAQWEGLGYYRRARSLHAGAAFVAERHGGRIPRDLAELKGIPGVGDYTAGAVASIAFGRPVPAVDGNVRRVLSRLYDEPTPTASWLRERAGLLVDPDRPGDWNQALMDLGATICTPRSPGCDACPLTSVCAARVAGTQELRPSRSARRAVPAVTFAVSVVVDRWGRAFVRRRPDKGLLAGLWAFPEAVIGDPTPDEPALVRQARHAAKEAGARTRERPRWILDVVRHRFTHLMATYVPVLLTAAGASAGDGRWVPLERPTGLALPRAQRKIAAAAWAAFETKETDADANP